MVKKISISIFLLLCLATFGIACGCGIAIAPIEVFNSLKETQAYLLIDVIDERTYNEMPFFRFISMEEPYDVTIVFPIDGIPYDVEGEKITAGEFLEDYGIKDAERIIERQSVSGLAKKVGKDMKEAGGPLFVLSNGFFGLATLFFGTLSRSTMGADFSKSAQGMMPLAHFEFEGGSLDIYDVDSMETLEQFVATLNMTMEGTLEELVTKYSDYFVAVLNLKVPSVLDEKSREVLKTCPKKAAKVKDMLQEKAVLKEADFEELFGRDYRRIAYSAVIGREIPDMAVSCDVALSRLVMAVTNADDRVNGTLVNMKFKDSGNFFYATSVVNSYKYPVTDQKYFVKVPSELDIKLSSSKVSKVGILDDKRWYRVDSTKEDLQGDIVDAGVIVKFGDTFRRMISSFYSQSWYFAFAAYVLILIILVALYIEFKGEEKLGWFDLGLFIPLFFLGGLVLSSIVFGIRKKKISLLFLALWLALLILSLI